MRISGFLPTALGLAGSLLIAAAADAGTLQDWRFDSTQNRLEFTTIGGVQPRAQFLANPARLVLDLPGIDVGTANRLLRIGGAIREVRIGQLDSQTTRIVIELNAGYTLNPADVLVRGNSPTQWWVQLPALTLAQTAADPAWEPTSPTSAVTNGATLLRGIQVTADGIFLQVDGANPPVQRRSSRDRNRITFELRHTSLAPELTEREFAINRFGVANLQLSQTGGASPTTRVTLSLSSRRNSDRDSEMPQWQAIASPLTGGGVVLVPGRGNGAPIAREPLPDYRPPVSRDRPPATAVANIRAVELTRDNQLLVRADQPIRATSSWDRSANAYRVTILNAQLTENMPGPRLDSSGPLRRVRLLQQDDRTVVVLVETNNNAQVTDIFQPGNQVVALQLQQFVAQSPYPSDTSRPSPRPTPDLPPTTPSPTPDLPRIPNSRIVVAIDPGHGGSDPGAVGRGGLKEVDVVLPIGLQVSSILQRQGVQVVMTRRDDREVELEPRVQIAEQANANLFVSIHANAISMDRPEVNGLETYYYSDAGARFGRVIHNTIVQTMGSQDRGLRQARFYVIRNTSMPAILIEVGYVTGAQDAPNLSNSAWRTRMAEAIARGILQYIQQNQQNL